MAYQCTDGSPCSGDPRAARRPFQAYRRTWEASNSREEGMNIETVVRGATISLGISH